MREHVASILASVVTVAGSVDDPTLDDSGFGSDPGFGGSDFGSPPPFFIAVAVFIGIAIVVSIIIAIYRAGKLASEGKNPLTLDQDLAAAALDRLRESPAERAAAATAAAPGSPTKSLEERLAEVDSLHSRGVISDSEHASARAAILSS